MPDCHAAFPTFHKRALALKRALVLAFAALVLLLAGCQPNTPPITVLPVATEVPPAATPSVPAFLLRPSPDLVRILCYNVNWDSIFPDGDPDNDMLRTANRAQQFARLLTAINPDIVCLQEINTSRDPQDVADILDAVIPLPGGQRWRAHKGYDNVIVSRWDMTLKADQKVHESRTVQRGHALALIDLPDGQHAFDLYLMNAHFKSSGGNINVALRQHHADALVQWIEDGKTAGGKIDLPASTPYMILGDLNAYDTDPAYHVTTLVTGDIVNEDKFGPDIKPDWDDTDLADALPRHNATGAETWTWRNDSDPFNPGALDRVIYSDSAMTIEHAFVLNTRAMSPADLATAGLKADDVMFRPLEGVYDHLPIVVDVAIP